MNGCHCFEHSSLFILKISQELKEWDSCRTLPKTPIFLALALIQYLMFDVHFFCYLYVEAFLYHSLRLC